VAGAELLDELDEPDELQAEMVTAMIATNTTLAFRSVPTFLIKAPHAFRRPAGIAFAVAAPAGCHTGRLASATVT
jgi:hypothetical protein